MIFVTGAGGFLGSFVRQKLIEYDLAFLGLIRYDSEIPNTLSLTNTYYGDLGDKPFIVRAMKQCSGVIHLASTLSVDISTVFEQDVQWMENLVERWNRGNFVFVSSMDVYPDVEDDTFFEESATWPTNPYGLGKLICERLLQEKYKNTSDRPNRTYKILRTPYILGKHERFPESVFGRIIHQALQGETFSLRDNCSGTSWVSAEELADFIVNIYDKPVSGVYNVANGWISWRDAIADIIRITGSKSRIIIGTKIGAGFRGVRGRRLATGKMEHELGFRLKKKFRTEIREILELSVYKYYQHK